MPNSPGPCMRAEELLHGWRPRRVGRRILVLPEVDSTNSRALAAADQPDADGLVVLADYQSAGRGRQGRTWLAPRGASVLCSVLLMIEDSTPTPRSAGSGTTGPATKVGGWLTLAAAVAACQAIREAAMVTPAIKWPNDLHVAGRKLAGILIESRDAEAGMRAWVVGIGINCLQHEGHFPPEIADTATSLDLVADHPVDRKEIARHLLRSLDEWLAVPPVPGDDALHHAWLSYAEPIGRRVRLWRDGREYTGSTIAVDPIGGLIVQADDGRREWFDPLLTTLLPL